MVTRSSPWRRRRGLILIALLVLVVALLASSRFYTDILWFNEVGLTSVLWTSLGTQFVLGIVVGVIVAAVVWLNLWIGARLVSPYRISDLTIGRQDPLQEVRENIRRYAGWIRLGIALFVGLSAGATAGSAWRTYLLWANRVEFGTNDPQFSRDIGFYVFELPFFEAVLSWIWFALIASLVVSAAAHSFYGSLRFDIGMAGVQPNAMAHLSVLLGLLALVKAMQYWLGRFQLNFSPRGVVTGASYTDVHAQLPALTLLTIISVISAVLF